MERHPQDHREEQPFVCGIDLGSTTAKLVVVDTRSRHVIHAAYRRHNARVRHTLDEMLARIPSAVSARPMAFRMTGSAALGLSEHLELPFVQEVVAAAAAMRMLHPDAHALIDIGGEDTKLILRSSDDRMDMRMNGSCAGGTGAFIDQMATLLAVDPADINRLATSHDEIHPIASRCGVFAKTDVQNLLSTGAGIPDILASVFRAVALQTVNALARGFPVEPKILLTGGPLTFFPLLRAMVIEAFGLNPHDAIELQHPKLVSALGASYAADVIDRTTDTQTLRERLAGYLDSTAARESDRDPALFETPMAFAAWEATRLTPVDRRGLSPNGGEIKAFLGIDAGSTTTKMILIDEAGRILLEDYRANHGKHLGAVRDGLAALARAIDASGADVRIVDAGVTGYGEHLLRTMLGLDSGIVETIAHVRAAQQLSPEVTFVLDIGGQDMKAMAIERGMVQRIEINEACSSGCGSFLQTFAETLGLSMQEFSESACGAARPCHLGSRCTVFMNSRVKQFLQEGATTAEISAGLAYAVVRNCLTKVLKIRDTGQLGKTVVVQGGTFLNPAVHRAFEILTGARVVCPEISGLMGAFGAALVARERYRKGPPPADERQLSLAEMIGVDAHAEPAITCSGCGNRCQIKRLTSVHGTFVSGNRCERIFSSHAKASRQGRNLVQAKHDLLFDRPFDPIDPAETPIRIGIPRVLNMFENLPFWTTLFVECGLSVVVSAPSSRPLFERGLPTVTSDNICMPAKLANGHVLDLIDRSVDRIFYPRIVYERKTRSAINSYNCPIVTGYPDVVRSAIDPQSNHGIPFDTPTLTFHDMGLMRRACWRYLRRLGVSRQRFLTAFARAIDEQEQYSRSLSQEIEETLEAAASDGRPVVSFVGRPYHLDPLINQGIPEKTAALGVDVIPGSHEWQDDCLENVQVLTQWAYPNRLYQAVRRASHHQHVEILQVNSFGCGPDALASDELRELLREQGRDLTVVRVDENASPGSILLRLRTLVETLEIRPRCENLEPPRRRRRLPAFLRRDRRRTILAPSLSDHLSPIIESEFTALGYRIEVLPPADRESLEHGLRYVNNEVCYPAILVIGDVLKALASGDYDPSDVAVGITQTGGQCRASCYLNLMSNALRAAGYGNIPAISLSMGQRLHRQPGFRLNSWALGVRGTASLIASDAISMMTRACQVRERHPGQSRALSQQLTGEWLAERRRDIPSLLAFLERAVSRFRDIPVDLRPLPRVGLVGEIYVKYGEYSNHRIVDWLTSRGVEVMIPPLFTFFFQGVRNRFHAQRAGIRRPSPFAWVLPLTERAVQGVLNRANEILRGLPYVTGFPDLRELATRASEVVPLASRYGEGWLLSGEMIHLAGLGAENILCLQPFGCLANQVVAKGVEKRLRSLHPSLRVLFIDLDHNTSQTNILNRVHFLVQNAKESASLRIGRLISQTRDRDTDSRLILP